MTTFIDFRFSRTLAAALFTGEEQEEVNVVLDPYRDNYLALGLAAGIGPGILARFVDPGGQAGAMLELCADRTVRLRNREGRDLVQTGPVPAGPAFVGIRTGPGRSGIRLRGDRSESESSLFGKTSAESPGNLRLECADGVRLMGRGSGRALRWGQLFYERDEPLGLCVELTMDWHHLRAGIPLFSTMTAEELVAQGRYRLRFRSYAYEASEAEATDFVRLFACEDPADIAVHMTPSLYTPTTPGIPNLAFAVSESDRVHPHLVERCNRMDRLCVPSTFVRDAFARSGVVPPVDVVLHGVDTDYFVPSESRLPLPGGRGFNFLAVGTHVERKNIKHLVRAFLEEFGEDEDVALFLLLRPEYHTTQNNVVLEFTDWERRWARHSAPILLWTGYLTREHLRDFYANADAYVMPSNEGFGLTLLEAMSCGTPAIGLDHGGVLDFLNRDNGILVPTAGTYVANDIDTLPYVGDEFRAPDMRSLRKSMRFMFENAEAAARMGSRARADAEKLSWRTVSLQFAEVIQGTYEAFHARPGRIPVPADPGPRLRELTVVLCVLDDARARQSLDCLRESSKQGIRVLCLFTRYARPRDVKLARKYGFVNYRWDGTMENARAISRAIYGQNWIVVLHSGEKITGDLNAARRFLRSLPPQVVEVSIDCGAKKMEPRLFQVRPPGGRPGRAECGDLAIRPLTTDRRR